MLFRSRGLKIGMPLQDATKLIASLISKPDGCVTANIGPNNADLYVYGDQIITCKNAMDYFGETTDVFNVFFVDGKINYVIFGYFTSETKSKEDRPSVYIALCEKYKVSPTVEKREVLEGSEYKIRSSFLDKNDKIGRAHV